MNFVEIFLNDPATAKLDLNQEFDIALQYSIADIRDITKRNAAFSKTIILPGTKNNNYWLGNLYDINADFTMFNPNKKTPCSISVNSEIVMKGFLQLRKIKKLVNVDQQGNTILYEVVVFNNAVDLMSELGEKPLNQLNLDELEHSYTKSNIIFSWTQSWTNGWVYPMYGLPNQSTNTYYVTDFYPAFYSKYLLFKIFQEAGFGITGSLLNNPQFEREIIPFVGSGSQSVSQELIDAENLRVGITQSFTFSNNGLLLPPVNSATTSSPGGVILSNGNTNPIWRPTFQYQLPVDNFQDPFNSQNNFYDNGNDWNTTTYVWTTSTNRKWAPQWQASWDLSIKNTDPSVSVKFTETPGVSSAGTIGVQKFKLKITHTVEYKLPNSLVFQTWPNGTNTILKEGWGWTSSAGVAPGETLSEHILSYVQCDEFFVPTGTTIRLRVKIQPDDSVNRYTMQYLSLSQNFPRVIRLQVNYRSTQNYFFSNGVVFAAQELDIIQPQTWISAKIKQKDFLADLIKRYNLYIQVSPDNERLLILDTRTDFYNKVLNLDWTKKKDFSSEDEITLLSELQFKEMLFTMKPDSSDNLNKDYTALTGDIYGQYKYTFSNDFVKGQQKIESPFSPTPLVKTGFGAVVAGLSPQDPKVNPRVLYWGGLKNAQQVNFSWEFKSYSQGSQYFSSYPYAGHFDDPFNPTLDIHFGTPQYMYYYDYLVLPTDTMYQTYWASYVDQIEDGKLVKSRFYLDEYDIRLIKDNFWAKIFIVDSYYYVNKIIDYKPMTNGLTTVELIKIKEGFAYKKQVGRTASIVRNPALVKDPVQVGNLGLNNGGLGLDGGLVIGSNNVGGGKVVSGSASFNQKQFILGDNNVVEGNNSGVIGGSNNFIKGTGNWLFKSSDNVVEEDGVFAIYRDGMTQSEPYVSWLGRGIKGDLAEKPGTYDKYLRGFNLQLEGYNLGQSDWRIVPESKEVILQTGKESTIKDLTVLGHHEIEGITATYSFGQDTKYRQGLVKVEENLNIDGLITVMGELFVGPAVLAGIGVFYSLQDQAGTASQSNQVLLDTANISDGVSINLNSQIVIQFVAAYRMTVTILVESSSNDIEDVIFWLKFNGQDYPYSSHIANVPGKKNATTPSDTIIQFEFIGKSQSANDIVELWWWTSSSDLKLKTRTIGSFPQSPSVIVNINKIG